MTKKLLALISVMMLAGSLVFFDRLQSAQFSDINPVSARKAEKIKNSLSETEFSDFTCLLCNDLRLPFDDQSNTFYVPLDMEDAEWEKLSFASGQPQYELLFEEDLTTADKRSAISSGRKFPFLIYDGKGWEQYSLVFTGLPVIDLSTAEGFYTENITGSVSFYDTDFTRHGILQSDYNGHIRGNTSRLYPKKGYKLNLLKKTANGTVVKNKEVLFGMREDDDWILYAMYNDETKLRDRLSIDLWNAYGASAVSKKSTYGTNMTYVELFADNRYCGLYGLMEPIDKKQLDLNAEDYLYKRKNPGDIDAEAFYTAEDPLAEVQGFELKEGNTDEESWLPMAGLGDFLTAKENKEPLPEGVTVDEDSALRMWLFLQIITGHDQTAKNIFYAARYMDGVYRFYFAPWDMDLTWGNVSVGETNPLFTAFEEETFDDLVRWETGDWLIAADENEAVRKVREMYTELRTSFLEEETLEDHIRTEDALLRESGAYARDEERWPYGAHTENCEQLIDYAKKRLAFLDRALWDFTAFDK